DEIAAAIVAAVDWLLGDPRRACEVLGAIQSEDTVKRIAQAASAGGEVLRKSEPLANEAFPDARVHTPLIIKVDADQSDLYGEEQFGPIAYLVATAGTDESLSKAAELARRAGAITWSVYSTDAGVLKSAEDACADAGAALSCNLTGQIYVNQAAAFSDFHVSGLNPSGNATLCDAAFVANRFRVVQTRTPA
ncbi:MAG: aldehyde dehydrogenase family protein, partial [Planctomycetes bacterium]|nr:aldehyde dehydrogenase family protein [Planctomycetota bacterium]